MKQKIETRQCAHVDDGVCNRCIHPMNPKNSRFYSNFMDSVSMVKVKNVELFKEVFRNG